MKLKYLRILTFIFVINKYVKGRENGKEGGRKGVRDFEFLTTICIGKGNI